MSNNNYNKTYEVCPHCGAEVELDADLNVQVCPNCGKYIVVCSMCEATYESANYCKDCCLCFRAEQLNKISR